MHLSNDGIVCLQAAGGDNCCMCGGATGKMAKCDNCPRNFHLQCLEPPLSKYVSAKFDVLSFPLRLFLLLQYFFFEFAPLGFLVFTECFSNF